MKLKIVQRPLNTVEVEGEIWLEMDGNDVLLKVKIDRCSCLVARLMPSSISMTGSIGITQNPYFTLLNR